MASREDAAPVHAGDELIGGRYRVTSLLGQGGMGIVYAAVDTASGRRLAIKRLRASLGAHTLELFKREFHTLRGLRHPNIIEVYDFASDAAGPFYTMELLDGGDLGRSAPMSFRQVGNCLRQLACVLGLVHARRLLHRDIAPRNIWIFPDGRLKLIDFGALSPFGVPSEVVGTLPLLAPEWLAHRAAHILVDQRADLYSLGALGYWLLTGQHAYQTQAEDLGRCWSQLPEPPSALVRQLADASLEPVPPELDALIMALLQPDAAARPDSTERVIDRLDTILGSAPEQACEAQHGWLHSRAFVGRSQELQIFQACLSEPESGLHSLVIEAAPGMGRSRLLEELAVLASLSGARSVLVRAETRDTPYALANTIAAGLSAQATTPLQRKLDLPLAADATPRGRQQLQQALTDWLLELAAERRVVILVDDAARADEESLAWLSALPRQLGCKGVLSVVSMPSAQQPIALEMFGRTARRIQLAPLTLPEVEQLLHSVFGPVDYLGRVASVLHRVSLGSPAHCTELLAHLVDRNLVRYADGAWTLPGHLSEAELPRSRSQLHLARFDELTEPARCLAEALSICEGQLTRAMAHALSELNEAETAAALVELVLAGVLRESAQGYGFVHPDVRDHALAALPPSRRTQVHLRCAGALLRGDDDPIAELRAGLHVWHAGDTRRCQELVLGAVRKLLQDLQRTSAAVSLLESLVALFRAANCPPRVLAGPLTALAAASYSADPRLAQRYGLAALTTLEGLLHLPWTHTLRGYVGKKPALLLALGRAALEQRSDIRELVFMLIVAAGSLNGVATGSFDHGLGMRCAQALEPFDVLGEQHIAGLICRTTRAVASMTAREDHAATLAELRALSALIASDLPIRDMPDDFRSFLLATSYYPLGVMECIRMNPVALSFADRIASTNSLDVVGADQLRAVYHSMRGEHARAAEYIERVETRALQAGTAWQIATLGPLHAHFTSLWTHDALLAKHAAAELTRLSYELPSLLPVAQRARATYLVLCGRYREAIDLMSDDRVPRRVMGWTLGQSVLARAYNRLGQHARAREVCLVALAGRSEEELSFVVMYLHAQLELALAEAAIGEPGQAHVRVQRLLENHRDVGPLALGAIHETCARIALREADLELARKHCKLMRRHYVATENATLYELAGQLAEQIDSIERPSPPAAASRLRWLGDNTELTTRSHFSRARSESAWQERARRGLHLALELTEAQRAFIVAAGGRRDVISLEPDAPPPEVVHWAESGEVAADDPGSVRFDDTRYCRLPIGPTPDTKAAPAVLVLAFEAESGAMPEAPMLSALARSLRAMLAQA